MQPLSFLLRVAPFGNTSRPLVLGHRGASHDYPENTQLAFREAIRQGADGVELDVMRCGSGEVVVFHDDDLTRLAAGQSGAEALIRKTPLTELRRFDVGRGERIPTLEEVLLALGDEVLVNVELKTETLVRTVDYLRLPLDDGLADAVTQVLSRCGRLTGNGKTLVSSFDPFQLLRFQSASHGRVPIGHLFDARQGPLTTGLYRLPLLRLAAVHPEAKLLDGPSIRRWKAQGLRINTWTVDEPTEVAAVSTLGVDAIITNRPGATLALLQQ